MAVAEGRRYAFEGEEKIDCGALEVFPFESKEQLITIETPEFSAVCPFSGLPDIARITVQYVPNKGKAVELKSLKYYFLSYRNVGVYQERVTQLIRAHLSAVLETEVRVTSIYNTRGGIDVTVSEGMVGTVDEGK